MIRVINADQAVTYTSTTSETVIVNSLIDIAAIGRGIDIDHDDDTSVVINGSVYASQFGIVVGNTRSDFSDARVTISDTGRVIGDLYAIGLSRASVDVTNAGFLHGGGTAAIVALQGTRFADILNTGTITSERVGIQIETTNGTGSGRVAVKNAGDIVTTSTSIVSDDSDLYITNTGTISGASTIRVVEGRLRLENSGVIDGQVGFSITNTEDFIINNTGTIFGGIQGATGQDRLNNTGLITGGIDTWRGDDTVRNSGEIEGYVDLGDGNDVYRGFDGAADSIAGGDGDDLIDLGTGMTTVLAGDGFDTVRTYGDVESLDSFSFDGDGGIEELIMLGGEDLSFLGDSYDNRVVGNTGANVIVAGAGNDVIVSRNGDDSIGGNAGNDVIIAGADDDILNGGERRDRLTGGTGADVFEYRSAADAGMTGATSDVIRDFSQGEDLIDVSALDPTGVSFETGAFAGGGTTSLRAIATGAGNSNVQIDTDGDGSADMLVIVLGVTGLTADDFLL